MFNYHQVDFFQFNSDQIMNSYIYNYVEARVNKLNSVQNVLQSSTCIKHFNVDEMMHSAIKSPKNAIWDLYNREEFPTPSYYLEYYYENEPSF